ncbi:MAG: inovirus-type Gp2 protein [Lentisphaeria bacterium]|nr:inovirus-type Gp2 protein [Lentisphaeria bacterium]
MSRKKITEQKETGYRFYKTYLNKGIEMIDYMSGRHGRVMQTRMDFRYPQEMDADGSNRDFSRALQGLTKELRREGYDPQYIGRREQKEQPHQHYHLNMLTDAKKHESRQRIIEKAERHWGNALGLTPEEVHEKQLVYPCNRDMNGDLRPNGYMLARRKGDFETTRRTMIRQMAYVTKYIPEDTTPSTTRKFFVSQYGKRQSDPEKI